MASVILVLLPLIAGIISSVCIRRQLQRSIARIDMERGVVAFSRRFVMWELLHVLLWLVIAIPLCYLLFWLLKSIAVLSVPGVSPEAIFITTNWPLWLICAIMLTFLTSVTPMGLLSRLLLGSRYEDFMAASLGRALHNPRGRLYTKFSWQLCLLIAAFCAGLGLLGSNYYIVFETDRVRVNGFWTLQENRYAYDQIAEIVSVAQVKAPNGNLRDRPHLAIRFDSGEVWTSLDGWHDPNSLRYQQLIQLIRSRTTLEPTSQTLIPW